MAEYEAFNLDRGTARAWRTFQTGLGDHLADMQDGDVLLIETAKTVSDHADRVAPYVQFLAWGGDQVRGEVPSNEYLSDEVALDEAAMVALAQIGWSAPTHGRGDESDDGSANFFIDIERRRADRLAAMTVAALRDVCGVVHPAFVAASNRNGEDDEALGVALGIPAAPSDGGELLDEALATMPTGAEHLQALVDAALVPVLGHAPRHDDDGDIPVSIGTSLVFVRVHRQAPVLQLFCVLADDVADSERAAFEVSKLNRACRLLKFLQIEDQVIACVQLPALPFVPAHLRDMLTLIAKVADDIDDDLVGRVGGRRAFQPEPETGPELASAEVTRADTDDDELAPELMTILQLDALEEGSVDADLAASICGDDRDLLLRLIQEASEQDMAWRRSRDAAMLEGDEEEAAACEHEGTAWEETVNTLRGALRLIVERGRTTGPRAPEPERAPAP